jgi:hypothetical protein
MEACESKMRRLEKGALGAGVTARDPGLTGALECVELSSRMAAKVRFDPVAADGMVALAHECPFRFVNNMMRWCVAKREKVAPSFAPEAGKKAGKV